MKKFRFSLETLLTVRQKQENIAHEKLIAAYSLFRKIQKYLNGLRKEQELLNQEIRAQRGDLYRDPLISYFDYLALLREKIALEEQRLKRAKWQLEERRKAVIAAMQKRKIIENVKDRRRVEWEAELNNQERAFFDELATIRHARNKSLSTNARS